jgi:hypothetical protein
MVPTGRANNEMRARYRRDARGFVARRVPASRTCRETAEAVMEAIATRVFSDVREERGEEWSPKVDPCRDVDELLAVVRLRGFDTSPRDFRAGFASVDTKRARVKRSKTRKFHFRTSD